MAVKLRLRREGAKKSPYYRVVAADGRSPRDGRFLEIIGRYHPREEPSRIEIDADRALYWLRNGAQPTEAVEQLLRVSGVWEQFRPGDPPRRERTATGPKLSRKRRAAAASAAAPPAAAAAPAAPATPPAEAATADPVVEPAEEEGS